MLLPVDASTTAAGPLATARRGALRTLRRPVVIVSEVAALAIASGLAASLPQQPEASEVERFANAWPALGRVTAALGLHDMLTSWWFLALVAMCLLSLLAVQAQQWPRLRRTWRAAPDPAAFARAPYRREAPLDSAREVPAAPRLRSRGRLALLGSPVFHLGLVIVMCAGIGRLLLYRDAVARVIEGETLAAAPDAFAAERGGWLSAPIVLPAALHLDGVRVEKYASGALEQLSANVTVLATPPRPTRIAINEPLELSSVRVYLANDHGLAVLLERASAAGTQQHVAWLEAREDELRGRLRLEDGLELRVRSRRSARDGAVEVRSLRGGVLSWIAELPPGASAGAGTGETVRVVAVLPWVLVRASRDASRPFFFAGVVIGILGVILMFGFNRVDEGVFVQGDRLVVALRPARFAPLYAEEFERLCRRWIR